MIDEMLNYFIFDNMNKIKNLHYKIYDTLTTFSYIRLNERFYNDFDNINHKKFVNNLDKEYFGLLFDLIEEYINLRKTYLFDNLVYYHSPIFS